MSDCIYSEECSDTDASCSNENEYIPIHLLSENWKLIENDAIPDISTKDVDAYFLYHKD
jgi:hypothetical protein